jgi:hypothetical protein
MRSGNPNRSWVISLLAVLDAASLQLALTKTLPRHNAVSILLHGSQALEVIFVMTQRRTQFRRRIPFVGRLFPHTRVTDGHTTKAPGIEPGEIAVEMAAAIDAVTGLPTEAVDSLRTGEAAPISLTRDEFDHGVEVLRKSGYPIENDLDEAWEQFATARARYEFTAYNLARRLEVIPSPWGGPRTHVFPVTWPTLATEFLKNDDA